MLTTTSQQLAWLAEFWPPRSGTLPKSPPTRFASSTVWNGSLVSATSCIR
jgi:hypothetical protein